MNTKKVIISIAVLIIAFIISLVASFYIYPLIHPNALKGKNNINLSNEVPKKAEKEIINNLKVTISGLHQTIDSLSAQQKESIGKIDSLKLVIQKKTDLIANLKKEKSTQKENVKFVTQSLLNLDEDKLSPIVNKLDIRQLMALYDTANNMQRQKLLQSLTPDKAADIVKKVML